MIFVDKKWGRKFKAKSAKIGNVVVFATDDSFLDRTDFALTIVGVGDNVDEDSFSELRENFYNLYQNYRPQSILDFGNVNFEEQTMLKLLSQLKRKKHHTVFLCENAEISANILFLQQNTKSKTTLVVPDVTSKNIQVAKLMKAKGSLAFIGHQIYLSDQVVLGRLAKKYVETLRLGEFRKNQSRVEPILRESDFMAIDFATVRSSDGGMPTSPNGLYAEELCSFAHIAGLSNKLSQLNIICNDSHPEITNQLAAQTIWYFADGLANRIVECPKKNKMQKFIVNMGDETTNLVFYKSSLTNRWWMEIIKGKNKRFVACSFDDYQKACSKDIPNLWLKEIQKNV